MVLPNQLTITRIILTPIFLFFFLMDVPWMKQLSLVIYIIAAITDWYDGWLARKFDYITDWGKFMDPLADKILTSTAFFAFVIIGVLNFWLVLLIVLRDIFITGLRIYADYNGYSFTTSFTAKVKTFLQMAFLYYLLLIYTLDTVGSLHSKYSEIFSVLKNQQAIQITLIIVMLATIITGIEYTIKNKTLIKKMFSFEAE
jgi:CDP-diacylglycerol--glycerol-3-phosphate 3-phosphatidyltransferase